MKNDIIQIHSYKHDKQLHRVWDNIRVLEEKENEIVVANYRTRVIESNGRFWKTKEPAICFFYDDCWYNVIAMLKDDGVYYYCNISSPFVLDAEGIKYIDYDLDVRIDPTFKYKILDKEEYKRHSIAMNYPEEIKFIVESALEELLNVIHDRKGPFNTEVVKEYFDQYKKTNKNIKCKSFD
ncbi:MAG: DUF402 domain-containing protein [bacterium]